MGGCCASSPNSRITCLNSMNSVRSEVSLTQAEMIELGIFLSEMPDHCQEIIKKIPAQQFYNVYRNHKMASNNGLKKNWSLAIAYEHRAIKELQALLPMHKDHYIFFHFYKVLSASSLALGEVESAIESIHIALAILLKHTPMDYETISKHYHYLANALKISQDWNGTVKYLSKAIETAQLVTDLDSKYHHMLEIELQIAKERMTEDVVNNLKLSEVKRKLGECEHEFRRRQTAETITFNAPYKTLAFNKRYSLSRS